MKSLPFALFMFSLFFLGWIGGTATALFGVFPSRQLMSGGRTVAAAVEAPFMSRNYLGRFLTGVPMPPEEAAESRWEIMPGARLRDATLAYGGLNQYREFCPEYGCLAVAFDEDGTPIANWPFRPREIYAADTVAADYPREVISFDPVANTYPVGIAVYPNGDLLAVFQSRGSVFPFAMGMTRVDRDGRPVWTRFDYSHHWPTLTSDEIAYVPGLKVASSEIEFVLGQGTGDHRIKLNCETGRPQVDTVQIVAPDGALLEEIDLLEIFTGSNWQGVLGETTDGCDPFHLNHIDVAEPDATGALAPGDIILSLRNLSRVAVLDGTTRRLKQVFAAGFVQQHSVHHLSGSRILVFDNQGGSASAGPSRIVELDLSTGAEKTLFPTDRTESRFTESFTGLAGHLEISPDRSRVFAAFTHQGQAIEFDISTGEVVALYDNLHDLSELEIAEDDQGDQAARFSIYGMRYLDDATRSFVESEIRR